MDPCPFVRLLVGNILVKLPSSSLPSAAARGVHPSNDTPCYCKIRLCSGNGRGGFRSQSQTAAVPVRLHSPAHDSDPASPPAASTSSSTTSTTSSTNSSPAVAAAFDLGPADLARLVGTPASRTKKPATKPLPPLSLTVEIYTGRRGAPTSSCFGALRSAGKLLGKVSVPVDLRGADLRSSVYHTGWVSLGKPSAGSTPEKASNNKPQVHLTVRSDPDPRFVFEFDAEPQCSPQVFQIQAGGNIRQPVFTCNFSTRRSNPSPPGAVPDQYSSYYRAPFTAMSTTSLDSDIHPSCSSSWLGSFGSSNDDRHQRRHRRNPSADRKGWSVTVHDLSGSPVAMASMITPFVPYRGTDRVSRSNPGAWLVMRPGDGTWKPWGKLEAWREGSGSDDGLGCRLHLMPDTAAANNDSNTVIAETTISARKGGKFAVDFIAGTAAAAINNNMPAVLPTNCTATNNGGSRSRSRQGSRSATPTPGCSPHGSGDLSNALVWPWNAYRGFVMSSTVEREGKTGRPGVEIGAHNVACTEDAALFVALAAAVDLSMDACAPFSQKLNKDLERAQD